MYRIIREVKHILDKNKIKFWPDCGTLLFMYRDSKLDPRDMDFSVYERDAKKVLLALNDFIKKGFHIHGVYDYKDKLTEVSFRKEGMAVDIFVRQKKGKYLVGYSKYDNNRYIAWGQPLKFFEKMGKINTDGNTYSIPYNTEDYLGYFYGKDWKIPKPDWNSATDAPCINEKWL